MAFCCSQRAFGIVFSVVRPGRPGDPESAPGSEGVSGGSAAEIPGVAGVEEGHAPPKIEATSSGTAWKQHSRLLSLTGIMPRGQNDGGRAAALWLEKFKP